MSDFNNNNNYNENRITTSGMTLFDDNGMMLRLGYLDDALSIVLGEVAVAENGKRSFPQSLRHPFIITMDRATSLYNDIILKKVLPAIEAGENYNGGVFINKRKDSIFEIRVQEGEIFLVLHKDIDADRVPKNSYVFTCGKTELIEGYKEGGDDFTQRNVEGVFMLFVKYLEAGIFDVHNSSAHAYRYGNRFTVEAIFNYLRSIALKLGATPERRSYNQASAGNYAPSRPSTPEEEPLPFMSETQPGDSLEELLS